MLGLYTIALALIAMLGLIARIDPFLDDMRKTFEKESKQN